MNETSALSATCGCNARCWMHLCSMLYAHARASPKHRHRWVLASVGRCAARMPLARHRCAKRSPWRMPASCAPRAPALRTNHTRCGKKAESRMTRMSPDPIGTARLSSTSIGPPLPSVMRPHSVSGMAAASTHTPAVSRRRWPPSRSRLDAPRHGAASCDTAQYAAHIWASKLCNDEG